MRNPNTFRDRVVGGVMLKRYMIVRRLRGMLCCGRIFPQLTFYLSPFVTIVCTIIAVFITGYVVAFAVVACVAMVATVSQLVTMIIEGDEDD